MRYFVHDPEGNIVQAGDIQPENLSTLNGPGRTVREGYADPRTQYFNLDTERVETYSQAQIESLSHWPGPGYRWSLGQWIDERQLEQAKLQKWNVIKRARTMAELGTFSVSGYEFDCDHDSQIRLAATFQAALDARANNESFSVNWTLADNSMVTLSRTQVIAVGRAMQAHIESQHYRARLRRAEIAAATSKAEVDAIVW